MVLKAPCLKNHIDRHRHENDRKHDLGDAVVKLEKLPSHVDKTMGVTEKFDKISVVIDKYDKLSAVKSFSSDVAVVKSEKIDKIVDPKRHRHYQRKSTTPSENSNDAGHFDVTPQASQSVHSTTESSSASNSPQPRRRKRKHAESQVETFHNTNPPVAPTTCRIIVEPSEIVIRDASSPPPLALLSKKSVNLIVRFNQFVTYPIFSALTIRFLMSRSHPFGSLRHRQLSSSMARLW